MTIAFFTNYVNHHQIPLADELYRVLGGNYHYIAICDTQELIKTMSGYKEIERSYIIRLYENEASRKKAYELAINSDVMIYGTPESLPLVSARYQAGKKGLIFEVGERWLKRGLLNLLSPRLLRNKWLYYTRCPKDSAFRLCASAYSAHDEEIMLSFKDKCLKWGYFTVVKEIDIESMIKLKEKASVVKILWVARFLRLKHPERMLRLAVALRNNGVNFSIDMIGEGPLFNWIKNDIEKKNLGDYVHLLGIMPNQELIKKMREYHIFCFTSDKKEGWGAVLNEAMSAGCCPVACKHIGSAPFLINDGENGFLYDDKKTGNFEAKVQWLIEHRVACSAMGKRAYETMINEWNPKEAAERLVKFSESFLEGNGCFYPNGPMSKADVL